MRERFSGTTLSPASRAVESARALDSYFATHWPALHVTKTHIVLGVMLVINIVVFASAFMATRRTDSPPDPETWYFVGALIAICVSIGWLIYRGMQYRLLPVVRGAKRASWIWLDLISLIAINGSAFMIPSFLEWRIRELKPEALFNQEYIRLGGKEDSLRSNDNDFGLYIWDFESVWKLKNKRVWELPPGVINDLLIYAPKSVLLDNEAHSVRLEGVAVAISNIYCFWNAHQRALWEGVPREFIFLWLGMIQGLVLWVASLPALTGRGLLGALAILILGTIVIAIVGLIADSESTVRFTMILFLGSMLLLALSGLLRERSTLLTRAAFGMSLLIPSCGGFFLWLWNDFETVAKGVYEPYSFLVLAIHPLLFPGYQYCINRLHAAPD